MGLLAEFRLGKGAVLFSSMGLHFQLQYPETRALLDSLLAYAAGEFAPDQEITRKELEEITGGVW